MNLISLDICKKSLNFQPDTPWPKNWPAFAWETSIVAGFNKTDQPVLNFNSEDVKFLHLFHSCHPQLNLSELSRIILKWESIEKPVFSWKDFFSLYKLQNPDFLIQILKLLSSTPPTFQEWANRKNLHPSELRILNSLNDLNETYSLFQWISEKNPSHSLGIKILELGVELSLMNIQVDKILKNQSSVEEAIRVMESQRNPLSSSSDQMKNSKLKKMIWPAHVHTQWQRKGDKTGLEVKIWCQNQKELEEKTKRIQQIKIFKHL